MGYQNKRINILATDIKKKKVIYCNTKEKREKERKEAKHEESKTEVYMYVIGTLVQ